MQLNFKQYLQQSIINLNSHCLLDTFRPPKVLNDVL